MRLRGVSWSSAESGCVIIPRHIYLTLRNLVGGGEGGWFFWGFVGGGCVAGEVRKSFEFFTKASSWTALIAAHLVGEGFILKLERATMAHDRST